MNTLNIGKQNRDTRADFIKVLAIIMVVLIHVVAMTVIVEEPSGQKWFWANCLDVFCRVAPPLFFMVSGAFLLSKDEPIGVFFKKRASKLLLPALFWSLVYFFYRLFFGTYSFQPFQFFKDLFFGDLYYHLWFINAIVVIYLVTPVFRRQFIASSLSVKVLGMVLLFIASFVISIESLLPSYFSNLLAYFGYFIFGNIAWNYFGASNKRVMSLAFALFTLASIFTTYNTWELSILKGEFVGVYYGYASIGIIVASLSIFMALLQYQPSQKLNTILTSISSCGLGIYLVHPLVLKIARVEAMDIQYPLGAICVTLSVFFVSYAIIYLLRKNMFSAKLV